MALLLSEMALCQKYEPETPHAEHVAQLALRLFDAAHRGLGVPFSERRLLESACRLHDIGFGEGARRHQERGAEIVAREGLAGCSPVARKIVAGAILLHRKNCEAALAHPIFEKSKHRLRATRLAAFLRIADAMDHGHIQDHAIVSVRLEAGVFAVVYRYNGYQDNSPWIEAKADIWRAVFSRGIRFEACPRSRRRVRFSDIVPKDVSVVEAARRMLYLNYRLMDDGRRALLEGTTAEALHDIRVAINRFCSILRFAGAFLGNTTAGKVLKTLKRFRSGLGSARDQEVWVRFLESDGTVRAAGGPELEACAEKQRRTLRRLLRNTALLLESGGYADASAAMVMLLRIQLPRLNKAAPGGQFRVFGASKLKKGVRKLIEKGGDPAGMTVGQLHSLRRRCKRIRYWAEFTAPVLGSRVRDLAGRARSLTGALGDVHDLDVYLEHCETEGIDPRSRLAGHIKRERARALRKASTSWRRLAEKKFVRTLRNRLDRAETEK